MVDVVVSSLSKTHHHDIVDFFIVNGVKTSITHIYLLYMLCEIIIIVKID
jgi:hypothetical protein